MRIILSSAGLRSDIHALFAIAEELRKRKHLITLCVPEKYRSQIMKLGHLMVTCGYGYEELLGGDRTGIKSEFVQKLASQIPLQFVALRDSLREADVLVGGKLIFAAPSLAQQLGIPYFQVIENPLLLDRKEYPAVGILHKRRGFMENMKRRERRKEWDELLGGAINRERGFSSQGPVKDFFDSLFRAGHMLLGLDPEITPVTAGENQAITGLLHFDDPHFADGPLPEFLAKGSDPIFIDRLTLKPANPFLPSLCKLLIQAGFRVAISSAWNIPESAMPEGCISLDACPSARLKAVVHSGSSECFTSALLAGVPQIVVPILEEESYWGERVTALGLGETMVGDLTAEALSASIQKTASNERSRQKSIEFGDKIRARNGAVAAADEIEKVAGDSIHGK